MDNISKEIITSSANGDINAFESLYKSCCGYVYNVAWRMVGKHEDAEEITQEVFLTLYRQLPKYRFESSFKTWIYRITTNCSIDYLRKISHQKQKSAQYFADPSNSSVFQPSNITIEEESAMAITLKMFDVLPLDQKACMVLRHIEGLSYQEIAEVLKININTVRTRLRKAREIMMMKRTEVIRNEM